MTSQLQIISAQEFLHLREAIVDNTDQMRQRRFLRFWPSVPVLMLGRPPQSTHVTSSAAPVARPR
jgi:hypothetical protein